MENKCISIEYKEYNSIDELPAAEKELLQSAIDATKGAYAPYSKFRVGAAVRLTNGKVIIGANQENAAYPSGLCAERTAMFSSHTLHPEAKMEAIALTAVDPSGNMLPTITYPCGACRQVMAEYENIAQAPITIIIGSSRAVQVFEGVSSIMPFMFDNLI